MDEGKFRRTYLRDLTACWGPTGRLLWLDLCVWGVLLGVHSIDSLRTSLFLPFLPLFLFLFSLLFFLRVRLLGIALGLYMEKSLRKHKER